MYIDKVTFDSVFDVSPLSGDFSFISRGRPEYGIRLGRGVVPVQGSTFAVAFAEPGNWATVLGSRNLASTEVFLSRPGWFQLSTIVDVIWYAPLLIVPSTLLAGPTGLLVSTAAIAAATICNLCRGVRRNKQVRQQLVAPAIQ